MTFVVKCAPVLKEWNWCCCSCSLRAASIVLAWLTAIANVTQFITCVVYLTHPTLRTTSYGYYDRTEVAASLLSGLVGSMILDALLLYGIHKKKSVYMLPFLVMDLIAIVVLAGAIMLITIFILPHNWAAGLLILSIGSGLLALASFFWVVQYSYYRQVEEEKNSSSGIVNYTYGIPTGHVQITTCPEDEKSLCPYPSKASAEVA